MTSPSVVYMKTGAGLAESSGKTNLLSALDKSILARVDGKAEPAEIARALDLEPEHARMVLSFLEQDGLIRPFLSPSSPKPSAQSPSEEALAGEIDPNASHSAADFDLERSFDLGGSESSLHEAPEGSVDGISLSVRSQSGKRGAFQNSSGRPAALPSLPSAPEGAEGSDPLSLEPMMSRESFRQEALLSAQKQQKLGAEIERERQQSERLALALKEAQTREREQTERAEAALKEATERAQREAEARARAERDLALAEQLRIAREAAEREREAKEALAREISEREKAERDARDAAARAETERLAGIERARLRRLGVFKARARMAAIAAVVLAAGVGALSLTRLIRVTPASCSEALSSWLAMPADVGSCDVSMLPTPSVIATGILAKDGSIAVKRATLRLSIPSLAWGSKKIKSATLEDARLSSEGLMAAASARRLDPSQAGWLESVSFENATLTAGSFEINGLSGSGKFLSSGAFDSARFYKESPALTIESRLLKGVPTLSIDARLAPESAIGSLGFEEASLSGSLVSGGLSLDELTLRHPAGLVQARGVLSWSKSEWSASGPFEARSLQAAALAPWLFLDGRASLSGDYSASGPTAESLARSLSATANGKADSAMVKLDIANAMGFGQTGGVSRFSSVNLGMSYANRSLSVTEASARSGSLSAQWSASRSPSGSVSGSLQSSLSTLSGGAMSFSISGNDKKLSLAPKP